LTLAAFVAIFPSIGFSRLRDALPPSGLAAPHPETIQSHIVDPRAHGIQRYAGDGRAPEGRAPGA